MNENAFLVYFKIVTLILWISVMNSIETQNLNAFSWMMMKEERNLHHCVCPQEITWQLLFAKSVSILYVDLRHIYECTCDTDTEIKSIFFSSWNITIIKVLTHLPFLYDSLKLDFDITWYRNLIWDYHTKMGDGSTPL